MLARGGYLALGFVAAGLAIAQALLGHAGFWPVLVFAAAPDLTLIAGFGNGLAQSQLHPRAVPFYNAVHRFWTPVLMVLAGLVLQSSFWTAAGLSWTAHIAFDRFFGFGLRASSGFQRPKGLSSAAF